MTAVLDPDVVRSASHRHQFDNLIVPFAAGASHDDVAIDAAGIARIDFEAREPLVIVAPLVSLAREGLRIRAVLDPSGTPTALPTLDFAPYTEQGASLPLYRPVLVGTSTAAPFAIALTGTRVAADGAETPIPVADLATLISLGVIEGILGRLLYASSAEKQRIRRQAREVLATRQLATARDDALDRIGADLSVPRFADTLSFDGAELVTSTARESDDEYRARLAIYRPFLLPTRRTLLERLNGPGPDASPNAGLPAATGVTRRFDVLEADNAFALAIQLVSAGDDTRRTNFLAFLRSMHLVQPDAPMPVDPYVATIRADEGAMRARLVTNFTFPTSPNLAPQLAIALDRVGRCRRALGATTPWVISRTQDDAGGSRFELGLGATLDAPSAAELDTLGAAVANPNRVPSPDPEVEALLRSMAPAPAAQDAEGSWLLTPCGLRTVHRLNTGSVYVSHFATFGMAITGPSTTPVKQPVTLEVRYNAPGDPGTNVVLAAGLASALAKWTAQGHPAWTVLSDADGAAQRQLATPVAAGSPAALAFAAAGLPVVTAPAPVVERLDQLPTELIETIRLAPAQSQAIQASPPVPAAADDLRQLADLLRAEGLASALPLVIGPTEVIIVVGAIGLPEAGINLSERRATGFRWYAVPIRGDGGTLVRAGQRVTFTPSGPGLTALVALGYARRGLTDPYEFRIDLPADATLTLRQYEYLMNLLDHTHPLGIEINTFAIRRQHVDLDGDGVADPLKPSVANTFRPFQRRRQRGETAVTL